jgi:hypothetical protein
MRRWLGLFVFILANPPDAAAIQDVERRVSEAAPRYTRAELSDGQGHLRFRLKYLKGC